MRVDENRIATRLVKCETELKSDMDYDLFGWAVGEAVGVEVPVITGLGKLTQTQIIKMNIELNMGGQVRMYHVPGLTQKLQQLSML
jgi:predicted aconitase